MKTSDSITKIAPALLKAQAAIKFAVKGDENPFFKSKYAGLPTVILCVKDPLNLNGIAFLQTPTQSDPGALSLTTRLIHQSGEWIEDTATCPLPKADPQGYGSAMTYLRRYSLAAICGVYQDDDDGEGAKATTTPKRDPRRPDAPAPAREAIKTLASFEGVKAIEAYAKNPVTAEIVEKAQAYYKAKALTDLTDVQANMIIRKCKAADEGAA